MRASFSVVANSTHRYQHIAETITLVAILTLAAALRFGWLGVNSFAFDEARLSLIALPMARGGAFATLGMPSSAGVPNLPAAAWIFALPYAISTDPLVATGFVGLVSLALVAGAWWLARRVWGAWAGIVTALYLGASPYSVLYARSIWAQNLLPPLALVWLWSGYVALAHRRRWAVALNVFMAGFVLQVHFAGASLVLGTAYLCVRGRWWRDLHAVLIGAGAVMVSLLPFVLRLARDPDIIRQFSSATGGDSRVDLNSVAELVRLALNRTWGFLTAGDPPPGIDPLWTLVGVGAVLFCGLAVVGLRSFPLFRHRATDHLAEITLVTLIVTPLLFLRHSVPVFIHYQLVALPAIALTAGAATRLIRRTWWSAAVTVLLVLVAAGWVTQIAGSLDLTGRVATGAGIGTPLRITREVAHSVPPDQPILFFTHGDDPHLDGEAAVFSVLWWGRDVRLVRGGSLLILPPQPAYLMATLPPIQAWEELDAAGLVADAQIIARRDGAGEPFIGMSYDGSQMLTGYTSLEPVRFADGSRLEAYRVRRVGERLRVSTVWHIESPPPGDAVFQQFHHLRTTETADGEPLLVADVPITVQRWRAGDVVVVMGDFFDVAAGDYWVDVGHYTLPTVERIPRLDGDGDFVRLPLTAPPEDP